MFLVTSRPIQSPDELAQREAPGLFGPAVHVARTVPARATALPSLLRGGRPRCWADAGAASAPTGRAGMGQRCQPVGGRPGRAVANEPKRRTLARATSGTRWPDNRRD